MWSVFTGWICLTFSFLHHEMKSHLTSLWQPQNSFIPTRLALSSAPLLSSLTAAISVIARLLVMRVPCVHCLLSDPLHSRSLLFNVRVLRCCMFYHHSCQGAGCCEELEPLRQDFCFFTFINNSGVWIFRHWRASCPDCESKHLLVFYIFSLLQQHLHGLCWERT